MTPDCRFSLPAAAPSRVPHDSTLDARSGFALRDEGGESALGLGRRLSRHLALDPQRVQPAAEPLLLASNDLTNGWPRDPRGSGDLVQRLSVGVCLADGVVALASGANDPLLGATRAEQGVCLL